MNYLVKIKSLSFDRQLQIIYFIVMMSETAREGHTALSENSHIVGPVSYTVRSG